MTNFAFSNPSGGEVYVDKSNLTIDIRWTGGPPKPSAQNVSLSLVDLGPTKNPNPYGQVVLAITGNITEPSAGVGQCAWVVPSTFAFNQNHYYVVYIQNAPAPATNWAYSQPFNIFPGPNAAPANFAFLNPFGGEVFVINKSNSTIDIQWTGGPAKPSAQNVSLSLVDLGPTKNPNPYGQVVLAITGNITEPSAGVGQCVWVVPSTFAFNQSHYYVVYIQNAPAPATNWAYSQPFNIFAGATVAPPSSGLASSSNYIIGSADGAALQNPSVTITIMEDLVIAPGVANFGFQMNSYSTKNANNVPSNEYVAWQQYLIVPQFNTQSVTCGYQGYLAAPPQGPGGQLFNSGPLSLVPLTSATTIPKNWTFTLALKSAPNDPNWNIIEADLTAADSTATPPWSITTKCKLLNLTLNAGGPVTSANVAPICAFQLNIVGPSGGTSTAVFKSGGGNITYTAQNQITAFSSVPPCAEVNNPTAEISNVSYSQLPTGTHGTLVQSFSA